MENKMIFRINLKYFHIIFVKHFHLLIRDTDNVCNAFRGNKSD